MPHIHQIQSTLQKQTERMELAAQEERMRKEAAALEASRKRSLPQPVEAEQGDAKRFKVEHSSAPDSLSELLLNFDFSSLPVGLVANIIIANLQLLTEQSLRNAIEVISIPTLSCFFRRNPLHFLRRSDKLTHQTVPLVPIYSLLQRRNLFPCLIRMRLLF